MNPPPPNPTPHQPDQPTQHPNSRLLPDGGYLGVLVASIVTTATAGLGCLASFLLTKCVWVLCVCYTCVLGGYHGKDDGTRPLPHGAGVCSHL